jgi:hypothetical protein
LSNSSIQQTACKALLRDAKLLQQLNMQCRHMLLLLLLMRNGTTRLAGRG